MKHEALLEHTSATPSVFCYAKSTSLPEGGLVLLLGGVAPDHRAV